MDFKKSFLSCYKTYESVPTRQDITDLNAHFRRRDALYRTLGLVPNNLEEKRILELGPGSGENSIYLASLRPSTYTLVDGTESSIQSLEKIRQKYYSDLSVELIYSDFLEFQSTAKYDAVFCEGAIPTQAFPEPMLRHIASFVKPGGILVITHRRCRFIPVRSHPPLSRKAPHWPTKPRFNSCYATC